MAITDRNYTLFIF